MQPYFVPYIGYFQLLHLCDTFVIHDDVQYVKQSWINRNRMLVGTTPGYYTIPVASHAATARICDVDLAPGYERTSRSLLARFETTYARAPYFGEARDLLREVLWSSASDLLSYLTSGLSLLASALGVGRPWQLASELPFEKSLTGQERVIAVARAVRCRTYINPPGGRGLYDPEVFRRAGMELRFLRPYIPDLRAASAASEAPFSVIDTIAMAGLNQAREWVRQGRAEL